MRLLLLTFVALAGVATAASAALPVGSASATVTPRVAGAKATVLTVSLGLELKCAKPPDVPIVVSLPRAWHVPKTVARTAVSIDGVRPDSVEVSNRTLTVQPSVPRRTCDVLAPGTITVDFARAAGLGNPRRAGVYTVRASIGTQDFSARVRIKP